MPVPKRKTSKRRRDQRQSCKFIVPQGFAACSECEAPIASHEVCASCGFYQGRKVLATKNDRGLKRLKERKELEAKKKTPEQADQQA